MLGLVRHMGAAILEFGYTRLFIAGRLPALVGALPALALAVKGDQLRSGRRLDAALQPDVRAFPDTSGPHRGVRCSSWQRWPRLFEIQSQAGIVSAANAALTAAQFL